MRPPISLLSAMRAPLTLRAAIAPPSNTLARSAISASTPHCRSLHTSSSLRVPAATQPAPVSSGNTESGVESASAVDPTGSAAARSAGAAETVESAGVVGVDELARGQARVGGVIAALGQGSGSGSGSGKSKVGEGEVLETTEELRVRAIRLYKELHRLGRDYPDPEYGFNKRLRRAYEKNSKETDPAALKKQLELAEHIKKVLALISLKKFRHLRRSYHANEGPR